MRSHVEQQSLDTSKATGRAGKMQDSDLVGHEACSTSR
jgi:hypothetical protein